MKQNLKFSALSAALVLAGCGGGGGGGFYGPNSPDTGTGAVVAPVATNYHIALISSKPTVVVTGDTATVTARLLDANGGGVADQDVVLSIPNTLSSGVTLSGPAKVKTDVNGNATFIITLPAGTSNAAALIKTGIQVNASFTDATNKVTSQTTIIGVVSSQPASASQYQLALTSSKSALIVTGDTTTVTVKALDSNGGGVAGQDVVLSLPTATIAKGVTIDGSSKATTDANGSAVFNIILAAASGSNATSLIAGGIDVNASITDASNVTTKQTVHLKVQAAAVVAANQYHLVMNTSKSTIVAGHDTATVTIKALDTNGGGVAGKTVLLNIPDSAKNGVTISGPSNATTDATGSATFTVISETNNNTVNLPALIASGVKLNATLTDPVTNTTTTQSTLLNAVSTLTPAPTIPLYHLAMGVSKPSIVITGDTAVVTVKALDVNGGAVASQDVTLQIPDTATNGVTISGPSTLKTDALGNAVFTVVLPTSNKNPASLLASGITFNSTVTDANNLSSTQSTKVNVIAAPVQVAAQYHLVMNSSKTSILAGGDTVSVTTKLLDANGGGVAGQSVVLSIPNSATNGVTINGSSAGITDVNGNVTFNLVLNSAGLTVAQKTALLKGVDVNSTFTDTNNVVVTQSTKINVSANASATPLYHLTMATSKPSLLVTGDTATVVVKALDAANGAVAGQNVTLTLPNAAALGLTITSPATVETDVNGNAIFTFALAGGTTANTSQLLAGGVVLQASITDSNGVTSNQSTKENVVTAAPALLPVYQVTIASNKPVMFVAGDTAIITTQLVDQNGGGVAGQNLVLSLPAAVINNGVTISGPSSVVTDVNGYATYTVKLANPATASALITSGIVATVTYTDANNTSTSQTTKVNVAQTLASAPLYHLTMTPSASTILASGGTTTVTVKALDNNAGGVAGQTVTLSIPDSATNGMTINGPSTAVTDAQGNAVFSVTLPDETSNAAIIASGVKLNASLTDSNNVTTSQTTRINVIQPPIPTSASYRIDLSPKDPTILVSDGTASVTTKLVDANGGGVAGQTVVLSIPDSATSGVTIDGPSTAVTDAQGNVTYRLKLPTTGTSATALIASGVVVNATYTASNGAPITQTTKINVAQSLATVSLYHLAVATSKSTILVTGDTATVTVQALDANNGGVANKNIVLSIPAASGMTINGSSTAVSDANGNAVFTVNLPAAGANATALIASGINVTATVTDSNNVSFSMPKHFNVAQSPTVNYHIDLTPSVPTVLVSTGTTNVMTKLVDANGGGVAGQTVVLSIPNSATSGVTIDGSATAITDVSGNVIYSLKLPTTGAKATALIASGVVVNATFTATNGAKITQTTKINVAQTLASAPLYHLAVVTSKPTIIVTGDTATVTVQALDTRNGGVANQNVSLSIPGASGMTINGSSSAVTDSSGKAVFTVNLPDASVYATALIASGIDVTATVTDSNNVSFSMPKHFNVIQSPVPTSATYRIDLTPSAPTILVSAGTTNVTTKLVDANGGGVAGQTVELSIPNSATSGVTIVGPSAAVTDANGNVTYSLQLPTTGVKATALITNGVVVNATFTATNGTKITQTTKINVAQTLASAPLYHLAVATSKSTILVTGDTATVTVQALDARNGGVANHNVMLSIPVASGMTISGSSTAVTDASGNAVFTVNLPAAGANASALIANGINVTATVTDANNVTFSMLKHFNVAAAPMPASASYNVVMSNSKSTLLVTGDTAVVTTKLIDINGGGVAGQSVVLSIPGAVAKGVTIDGSSTGVTDVSGNVSFTLKLTAASNVNKVNLIASGVTVNATYTATDGTIRANTTLLNVVNSSSNSQYHLTMGSTRSTVTLGTTTNITVTAADVNGGGVAGQTVVLSLPDTLTNGVLINGPSTAVTDIFGNAVFTLNIPANLPAGTTLASLVTSGIRVNASLTDTTGATTKQTTLLNVSSSVIPPVGQISISYSNLIGSDPTNVYYLLNMSANVVGTDGKPAINQTVTMTAKQLQYQKGGSVFVTPQWQTNPSKTCTPTSPVNTPYSPITFVGALTNTTSTATYQTDSTGKFDFTVRYGKNYAGWLTAAFGASTTLSGVTTASLPVTIKLPAAVSDISDGNSAPPNGNSPYNAIPNATDASICTP